jgi:hypothetical protein
MSNSQGSLPLETPLAIAFVVGIFVVAVVMAKRSSSKYTKAVQEFAQVQGWSYSDSLNDTQGITQGLNAKAEELFPEEKFDVRTIMTVESGRRSVFLFDGWYGYRGRGKKHLGNGCVIESNRFRSVGSQVEINPRNRLDGILLSGQVDMGDSEFAQHFIVQSKDATSVKKIIGESMQAVLLEHMKAPLFNPVRIAIGTSGAVLLTGYHAEPERWLDLVDLARRIESTLE